MQKQQIIDKLQSHRGMLHPTFASEVWSASKLVDWTIGDPIFETGQRSLL